MSGGPSNPAPAPTLDDVDRAICDAVDVVGLIGGVLADHVRPSPDAMKAMVTALRLAIGRLDNARRAIEVMRGDAP